VDPSEQRELVPDIVVVSNPHLPENSTIIHKTKIQCLKYGFAASGGGCSGRNDMVMGISGTRRREKIASKPAPERQRKKGGDPLLFELRSQPPADGRQSELV